MNTGKTGLPRRPRDAPKGETDSASGHQASGGAHGNHHHHGPARHDRAFAIGVTLNLGFVGIEAFYGFAVNSLALVADAGHNFGDVVGLLLAWAAVWLSRKRATKRHTYGLGRATIVVSLVNAVILLLGTGGIAWEAVHRLASPQPVVGQAVMWVAAAGIAVNTATAVLFLAGRKDDINIRGAFLHMAADAGTALGVVVAALTMSRTGWLWLDPAVSLAIAAVISVGSWGLLRESLDLALDAVPAGIDCAAVEGFLSGIPGVVAIHDLHIWPLSTTSVALSAHLVGVAGGGDDALLHRIGAALRQKFGIDHATLQIEAKGRGCPLADTHCGSPRSVSA